MVVRRAIAEPGTVAPRGHHGLLCHPAAGLFQGKFSLKIFKMGKKSVLFVDLKENSTPTVELITLGHIIK